MIFSQFWKKISPMDPHLITAHAKINAGTDGIITAAHLEDQDRPVQEVLSVLDKAIISLHDAKAAVVFYRNQVYHKHFVDVVEEQPHGSPRPIGDEAPLPSATELPPLPGGSDCRPLPEAGHGRFGNESPGPDVEAGPWIAGAAYAGQSHETDRG
jgi:hypothetical protein